MRLAYVALILLARARAYNNNDKKKLQLNDPPLAGLFSDDTGKSRNILQACKNILP